ncbi:Protein of unknown function [Paenibacillus polysaccharolyticus]|uniref:DUF3891 domain-containing protein n=1 Tax=Paenibacillus polysaccharolyticus TaxID=582692 RepID=A0A1G5JQ34_9BACL|nr:DUF3891 family protein [Paenibacillus polysaccharolyticus]SCY89829.1 Protein of unknown function [Paenibacillus polysaccharolyticus]
MIVYEREHDFVLTAQHEHGIVAGDMASHWKKKWLPHESHRDDLILAAKEHDRGWIDLDAAPLWNDYSQIPYSFRDFPLRPRFVFYRKGIEEVRQQNPYAGLLCSLMYTELFQKTLGANSEDDDDIRQYLQEEQLQQESWKKELGVNASELEEQLKNDVEIMLFCDQLSLFLCMEEPGTPTARYDFFAEGLGCGFDTCPSSNVQVEWVSGEKVALSFFPFDEEFEVTMSYKVIPKASIRKFGMLQAYRRADWKKRQIWITAVS